MNAGLIFGAGSQVYFKLNVPGTGSSEMVSEVKLG